MSGAPSSASNATEFTVFFAIQYGFIRRAMAKLATIPTLRDVHECSVRLVRAKVVAESVSALDAATQCSQVLKNTNMFLRMWLALVHVGPPSPLLQLLKSRTRSDDTAERWLQVLPEDVRPLLPNKE